MPVSVRWVSLLLETAHRHALFGWVREQCVSIRLFGMRVCLGWTSAAGTGRWCGRLAEVKQQVDKQGSPLGVGSHTALGGAPRRVGVEPGPPKFGPPTPV